MILKLHVKSNLMKWKKQTNLFFSKMPCPVSIKWKPTVYCKGARYHPKLDIAISIYRQAYTRDNDTITILSFNPIISGLTII